MGVARGRARRAAVVGVLGIAVVMAGCTGEQEPEVPSASSTSTEASPAPTPTTPPAPELGAYGVSTGHPLASRAGMEMLEKGGNAVDAAIAAAFADGVMQPASSGIGGGGSAIIVDGEDIANLDYRDAANLSGVVPSSGTGVPGFVTGMTTLHEQYGSLEWAELLEPAIRLADQGAPVSRYLASSINANLGRQVVGSLDHFRGPGGELLQEGETLVQAELAETMRVIARDGQQALLDGPLAAALHSVEGVDRESLAAYEVQESVPPSGKVGDYTMLSGAAALPGAAIIQMVQIAEAAGIADVEPGSAEFVDLQSRAWVVADNSVQTLFGDPDFVDVPEQTLTDQEANAAIGLSLPPATQTSLSPDYDGAPNTTHISVVDEDGMAVSMTNTITNYWGSGQYVAGFFMNDQLERFTDIGVSGKNAPGPGRRSVTWSSPSMLLDAQGRPALVIGAPGGRQIPNTTAQVVTLWALHGLSLEEAVLMDRFILDAGQLRLESDRLAEQMRQKGYDVRVTSAAWIPAYGSVQALAVDWDAGQVVGFADPRRSAGYEVADSADTQG